MNIKQPFCTVYYYLGRHTAPKDYAKISDNLLDRIAESRLTEKYCNLF